MGYEELASLIEREVIRYSIPTSAIALISKGALVYYNEFKTDRSAIGTKENPTIFRAGSISKVLNAITIMQHYEKGIVDIDRSISYYCPELYFHDRSGKNTQITIRQLISHTAGLQRESPVGNYFDASEPDMKDTVESIIGSELVYSPATRYKYSNIGPTVAAYVLESVTGISFVEQIERSIFNPLGMNNSFFTMKSRPKATIVQNTIMTDFDGLPFPAPDFELGTSPSGGLYSTGPDLANLLSCLLSQGNGEFGRNLDSDIINNMFTKQLAIKGDEPGFGLGFVIGSDINSPTFSHGGAIYGFSTEIYALTDENIGVVMLNNLDCAVGPNVKIRTAAIEVLRTNEIKRAAILPTASNFRPPPYPESYVGLFRGSDSDINIEMESGELFLRSYGTRKRIYSTGVDKFVTDDRLSWGVCVSFQRENNKTVSNLTLSGKRFDFIKNRQINLLPNDSDFHVKTLMMEGYCGDYGPPYAVLRILIRDGKLCCLVEWHFEYPLTMVDDFIFDFPDYGMYKGESLRFEADEENQIISVSLSGIRFERIVKDE